METPKETKDPSALTEKAGEALSEKQDCARAVEGMIVERGTPDYREMKNMVFEHLVSQRLYDDFLSSLEDVEYVMSDEDENAFLDSLRGMSSSEQLAVFSVPHEIRERRLSVLRENGVPIEGVAQILQDEASREGFTIGYHVSPFEIKKERGQFDEEIWRIKGSELDDRDDRKMAYYSLDYENMFRKKRGDFIYLVRAHVGEKTSHKQDTSNNWGRADELSIVGQMENLTEIDEKVAMVVDEINKNHSAEEVVE